MGWHVSRAPALSASMRGPVQNQAGPAPLAQDPGCSRCLVPGATWRDLCLVHSHPREAALAGPGGMLMLVGGAYPSLSWRLLRDSSAPALVICLE